MAPMHEPLTTAGFAWFSINYRLAPKHPYPACVEDVETALSWVKEHAAEFQVDPKRIAFSGESAGGHLVALSAVRATDATRVAAVVPFYGVFDLVGQVGHPQPGDTLDATMQKLFGSDKFDGPTATLMHEASPIEHVKPGLPPFLLVHGSDDTKVNHRQATDFQAALIKAGVPCELITVNGGGHGMKGWAALHSDYKAQIVAWLQRTLTPTTSGKPEASPLHQPEGVESKDFRKITINNVEPRRDVTGEIVDAHDGCLQLFNQRYYLYGTAYAKSAGFGINNRFRVYSSPDLERWTFEGELLKETTDGVYYRPYVVFNPNTRKYVLWYNWYPKLWDDLPAYIWQISSRGRGWQHDQP